MVFGNGVKNIQAVAYIGARTVYYVLGKKFDWVVLAFSDSASLYKQARTFLILSEIGAQKV